MLTNSLFIVAHAVGRDVWCNARASHARVYTCASHCTVSCSAKYAKCVDGCPTTQQFPML